MPAAAGLGGRGPSNRSRLGNLTNTAGDASDAAAGQSKRKPSSLARAAAALQQGTAGGGGGEEVLPTSPVSTSPTSAFSERSRSRLLGGERWRPRRQRRQQAQGPTHAQQLQMRVLELHRRGHAVPLPDEEAAADAGALMHRYDEDDDDY